MDDLNIRITALLNQATSTTNIKKQSKQIEETLAKTPIQMRIEANTGIAMQEMSKSAKAYQQIWEKAFYNQKQSAIKNANEIKNAYNSQLFQNFNKSIGIGQNTGITESNSALKQYYETVSKLNKVSTIPTSEVIENTFSSNNTNKITKQNSALAELFEKSSKSKVGMSALQKEVVKLNPAMAELNNTTEKSAQSFANSLAKFSQWMIVGTLIMQPLRMLREGTNYILDLDNAMNQVQIVTGKTKSQVDDLALSYNKLAKEMSVTTSEIANTSADLYRQGLGDSQVEDRMKGIIEYAKISSISLDDANTIITASANATGESVQKIIDVFSQLGDTTASDASEVGEAMQRVASASENSNISLEKSASWLSTISSISRESASTIGRSLNSIISRYESIKSKGFNEEDATQINDVTKALSAVGINPTVNGQLRDLGEVMDEVGSKWTGLTKNEKAYIATTMAGTYQRNRFITLMNNYDDSLKNYENALNSAGTAEKKFDIYQESAQAHMDKFQASLDSLWQKSLNSNFLKDLIDSGTEFIDVLTDIVNNPMTKWIAVASLGALAGKALALAFTAIASSNFVSIFTQFSATIGTTRATMLALNATLLASPLFWGAVAITGIYAIAKAVDYCTVSFAEQKKMVEDITGEVSSLQSEYDQLSSKNFLTDEEQKKLDILNQQIKAKQDLLALEQKEANKKYVEEYTQSTDGFSGFREIDKNNLEIEKYKKNLKELQDINTKIGKEQNADKRASLRDDYDKLSAKVKTTEVSFSDLYQTMTEEKANGAHFTDDMEEQYQTLGQLVLASEDLQECNASLGSSYVLISGALDKVTDKKALTKKETDQLVTLYPELTDAVTETADGFYIEADALNNLSDTAKQSALAQIATQINLTTSVVDEAEKRIKAYGLEAEAQQNLANIQISSNKTFEAYAKKNVPNYTPAPTDSNVDNMAKDHLDNLHSLYAKIQAIHAGGNSGGGNPDGGNTDSSPSPIDPQDMADAFIKSANAEYKMSEAQAKSLERQIKTAESAKDYTKELALQQQLLENNNTQVEQLKTANEKISAEASRLRANSIYGEASKKWFDVNGESTAEYIRLLESFAGKTDDVSKSQYEAITDLYKNLSTLKGGWYDNVEAINTVKDSIDSVKQSMKDTVTTMYSSMQKLAKKQFDKEKKELQDQLKDDDDYYDRKIQRIQDKIDALDKEADTENKLLAIEKARIALAKVQDQNTKRVYKEGEGFVWGADQEAVSDAQSSLDDLLTEWDKTQKKLDLQEQVDDLKDAKERNEKSINEQIDDLENLSNTWDESLDITDEIDGYSGNLDTLVGLETDSYKKRLALAQQFATDYSNAMSAITSGSYSTTAVNGASGGSGSGTSSSNGVYYNKNVDYQARINDAVKSGNYSEAKKAEQQRNAKIDGEKLNEKKTKKYATGGLVDYTGLAQVDGTPSKPEYVLNPEQTALFTQCMEMPNLLSNLNLFKSLNFDFIKPINNQPALQLSIGDIVVKGVQDVNGFADAVIKQFPNTMVQKLYER